VRDVTVLACVAILGLSIVASACIMQGIDHAIAMGTGAAIVEIVHLAYRRLKKA